MAEYKIGVINFGSTSTKVAYYEDDKMLFVENIKHTTKELSQFEEIFDQLDFRYKKIKTCFEEHGVDVCQLNCIASRGGNIAPRPGGVYKITRDMAEESASGKYGVHPSDLGPSIALKIAEEGPLPITCDPPTTDEFTSLARYSGIPEISRISSFQALNQRAVGKKHAELKGMNYDQLNLIIAHMGGGISVVVHNHGRMVDGNNALYGDGPFSTNRAGGLPSGDLVNLCFSGKYSHKEMLKKINGKGGLVAYVGENDVQIIENKAKTDDKCREVLEAMCYQVGKEIGSAATVVNGKVDAILISGGMANSEWLMQLIKEKVEFIAPVFLYPGEFEMETLAGNALAVLRGEVIPMEI